MMVRRVAYAVLFAMLAALGACAPMLAPRGLESVPPGVASDAFVTRDGISLPLRHWDAPHPRAIIVALHGMSDYSNAFDMPGTWWAAQGITTYAYDQRDFGRAPNPGLWPGGDALRRDLSDFVAATRAAHPGIPVYALGESMGGAVVLSSLASADRPRVDGVILVAPAVWSREDMPLSYRVALWTVAHTLPSISLSGNGLGIWPSDNIPMLRKLSRDPLFQHTTRADAVYGLVDLMDEARKAPAQLDHPPPILFLYGKNDQVIPAPPTEATISALGSRAQVHRYDHGYHMLLRDLDAQTVWADVVTWISDRSENVAGK
jgi:alpha-beta hydrolase superfamily lysophospholipase